MAVAEIVGGDRPLSQQLALREDTERRARLTRAAGTASEREPPARDQSRPTLASARSVAAAISSTSRSRIGVDRQPSPVV